MRRTSLLAIALLTIGCSSHSAVAPSPGSRSISSGNSTLDQSAAFANLMGMPSPARPLTAHHLKSFDECPAKGPIKYISDDSQSVIYIYAGKFAGQAPCGQIASSLLSAPQGLYVKADTHDLYVANTFGSNILVFHRGQSDPYNVYADPTDQFTAHVTVAKDGTVIASNGWQPSRAENGSISTWTGGPNGGKFIGNFAMANGGYGLSITVRKNDTVYYSDVHLQGRASVWTVSCPAGACGVQTRVAGLSFKSPGGMEFDTENDLVILDAANFRADTFELPDPAPSTFPLLTNHPIDMAINRLDHHLFTADWETNEATEYLYPSGTVVGKVSGSRRGDMKGIAVDPGPTR